MPQLILCGLPGCGKTTIGISLAEALQYPFFDTDRYIEYLYTQHTEDKLSGREIMQKKGEAYFRALEKESIAKLPLTRNTVIALGGGAILDRQNRKYVRSLGSIIYLKEEPTILFQQAILSGMPTYLDPLSPRSSYQELASFREPLYAEIAHWTILLKKRTPAEIVTEILQIITLEK
jgi:shikimate kinase